MPKEKISVLFIEDDVIETMKMHRAVAKIDGDYFIKEAKNGEEALTILSQKDNLPNIILLDLNMPKMNGIEFLTILKNDERLKSIPTIVLTTSNNQKDMLTCYEIGIAGYVLKPLKYEDYILKLEKILSYWSINELIKL